MLNNEFEKQVESAMLLIAQEQIPDTPHRFPPDFEARLIQQTADTGIEQTHMKTAQPQPIRVHKSKSAGLVSRLLTWGSLAAGVMAAVTVGAVMLHEQRDEMQQLSSIPVETVENASSDRDAAAISTSTQPVENRQHETIAEQAISSILTTESTASPAKTSVTAIETRSLPETETTASQKADNPEFASSAKSTKAILSSETSTTAAMTAVTTTQAQTTVTNSAPYQKTGAAGLFEKYAFDFPVYQIDGGYAVSIDNENIHCYDLNGNEIDCRWSNCRIFDNPYRYSEFHAEEDVSINPYDFIYTCNCENGIYYAVLDNGTAIIAGADRAWLDENKPETLVIPEEINGFRVTEIASRAFDSIGMKCESLHEIRIADTVEIIHPYAFENAFLNRAGAKINIPANVKTICRRAFSGNNDAVGEKYVGKEKADRVIILPDSLEYLQADAFTSETRYIFKMPESPVLSDSILIGSNRSVESADLSQYPDNYFEKYYVDGNFNVVTFRDAVQYFSAKETQ